VFRIPAIGTLHMKWKLIGLLLVLWGGAVVSSVIVFWDPLGHQTMRAILALPTGGALIWSGIRCIRPVLPVAINDGFETADLAKIPAPSPPWSARKFPGWAAPFVGIAVGAAIGLKIAATQGPQGHLSFLESMFLAVGLGFGGGCTVWLRESSRNRASRRSAELATPADERINRPR
jgi:hypothetical protein